MLILIYLAIGAAISLLILRLIVQFYVRRAAAQSRRFSVWEVIKTELIVAIAWPIWVWLWALDAAEDRWLRKRREAKRAARDKALEAMTPEQRAQYDQWTIRWLNILRRFDWFMVKVYFPCYVAYSFFVLVFGVILLVTGYDPLDGKVATTAQGWSHVAVGVAPLVAFASVWWSERKAKRELQRIFPGGEA